MREPSTRPLEPNEYARIEDVLKCLREHFHEWPNYHDDEHGLIAFAFYEGCGGKCCGAILAAAAPFALGKELVKEHGFRWVMIPTESGWHFGVESERLANPIDLEILEDGSWKEHGYDEQPDPGEMTNDSLEYILDQIGVKRDSW